MAGCLLLDRIASCYLFKLIMILGSLIRPPCLYAVVPVAQGLPVAPVPEELLITTMWNNVVHIRCLHEPAFLHALHAQRVCLQEGFSGFLPSATIASTTCTPHFFRMHWLMCLTVFRSVRNQCGATGMAARRFRAAGHHCSQGSSFFPKWP